jgi:hypothetical protein
LFIGLFISVFLYRDRINVRVLELEMDFGTRSAVINRADSLFQVLDSHPETQGIGVVVIADRALFWLRPVGG